MAAASDTHDPLTRAHPVVCIVGPTASGKSDLAQQVALQLDGEVVSADSMQIYRGMDIGTGKVLAPERLVPHYGLDLVNPGEEYSAALFQEYARACFTHIQARNKRPVLCGGTGFYVRAAIDSYEFPAGDQTDNPVRAYYTQYASEQGNEALWQLLHEQDPDSAAVIHPNNMRRVVRAFELLAEGESYARQKQNLASIPQEVPAVFFAIDIERSTLNERIYARVDSMFEHGLVREVVQLLDQGFREGITAPQAIGYKEVVAALDGECSLDQARDQIKIATRRYAKRQMSWFRHDHRIAWLNGNDATTDKLCEEVLMRLEEGRHDG